MQKFINLSAVDSKGLDRIIFKNAKNLKKDSDLLSKNNSFNSATSLLILSSEEVIKAILVLLHSQGTRVYLVKNAKKFFSDHKIRHEVAKLLDIGISLMESSSVYDENGKTNLMRTGIKWLDNFTNNLIDIIKASEPIFDSLNRIELLKSFDKLKNRGLYTDYYDKILIPNTEITERKYNRVKELTSRVFNFYKILNIIYHPSLEKHISKKEIQEYQEMLKDTINQLSTYDFSKVNKFLN